VDRLDAALSEAIDVLGRLRANLERFNEIVAVCQRCLALEGRILVAGNGGSAASSQHFAAELVGRLEVDRGALPALALTADTATITALANDYGFEHVFSRQIQALAKSNDLLLVISGSGRSPNLIQACRTAHQIGICTIGLLGGDGGQLVNILDHSIIVPSSNTARVQEAHLIMLHEIAHCLELEHMPDSSALPTRPDRT
jgi:D-sedoheptulose 7-phosphate isomerase